MRSARALGTISSQDYPPQSRASTLPSSQTSRQLINGCSIAIAHDYLNQRGGAERVALELSDIWPHAPIYTSLYRPESTLPGFSGRTIYTSFLDRLPVDRAFRNLLPLYPSAFRSFGMLHHDVVISSSSGWAHGVRTSPASLHVVYCHTPARWLYGGEYLGASVRQMLLSPIAPALRAWDKSAARRPALYIANSAAVRTRIRRLYRRDAQVVHPPVEVERFTPKPRGERLLVVSRLLPYKRVDLLVQAATKASHPMDVVGTGPALRELRALAGPTVRFHGQVDDPVVTELMQDCRTLCVAAEEDFGITPVEAMAAGKPVVAFGASGALETIIDGVTGVFFPSHRVDSVLRAIERCDQLDSSPDEIASHARRFSKATFQERLTTAICDALSATRP